jgi:hypothetical protein
MINAHIMFHYVPFCAQKRNLLHHDMKLLSCPPSSAISFICRSPTEELLQL